MSGNALLEEAALRQRLGFTPDLREISKKICVEFRLGSFRKHEVNFLGYEDINFFMKTSKGLFFVKIYASSRTLRECKRITNIVVKAYNAKVSVPKLYKSSQGYLHSIKIGNSTLRLCVMDFINGKDLFSSKSKIKRKEILFLARQAAIMSSIKLKPPKIYDSWAIPNFPAEFRKKSKFLSVAELKIMKPLLKQLKELKIERLPHCFVHGDILTTNVVKDKDGSLSIIDFSVSNYYPRIIELAVLSCDILFNPGNKAESHKNLKLVLEEYQKKIKLTEKELSALSVLINVGHAMHLLRATYEKKVNKNKSLVNEYFLEKGKAGLKQSF